MVMTRPSQATEEVCAGTISDVDWAILIAFRNESRRLETCEWVLAGMPATFRVEASQTTGLIVHTPNRPTDAQVAEVLLRLRPFILQREPQFYNRVAGVLAGYFDHPWLREDMRKASDRFSGADQVGLYTLTRNILPINTPATFDLWLNAFEFHRDPDKYERFVRESGGEPGPLEHAVFRSMLVGKVDAVFGLGSVITAIEQAPSATARGDAPAA